MCERAYGLHLTARSLLEQLEHWRAAFPDSNFLVPCAMASSSNEQNPASAFGETNKQKVAIWQLAHARWRSWERVHHFSKVAKWTKNSASWEERHTRHALFYGKSDGIQGPRQVNLSLWRGDVTLKTIHMRLQDHPVVERGSIEVLKKSMRPQDNHESLFKYRFQLKYGFWLTAGYSRSKDGGIQGGRTHAWAAFGANCVTRVFKELACDFLLALCGYGPMFGHHRQGKAKWVPKEAQHDEPDKPMPHRAPPTPPLAEEVIHGGDDKPMPHRAPPAPIQSLAEEVIHGGDVTHGREEKKGDEEDVIHGIEEKKVTCEEVIHDQETKQSQPLAGLPISDWTASFVAQLFDSLGWNVASASVMNDGIDGQFLENMTILELSELGVPYGELPSFRLRITELAAMTKKTWAEQVEQEEREQEEAQAKFAGSQPLAGEDFNNDEEDVEVGSERDVSDGERQGEASEAEELNYMRTLRQVRRISGTYPWAPCASNLTAPILLQHDIQ